MLTHGFTSRTAIKFDESQHKRVPAGSGHGGEFTRTGGSAALDASPEEPTPEQRQAHADVVRQTAKPVHHVKTAEEAVERVLRGENVEIETTKDVHTILKKLGEIAIEAKSKKSEAPNFDPCSITVKGVSLFCTERIVTDEFPGGVPRLAMPQFKSKNPVPGSPADALPRVKGEVDATQAFLDHLESAGVKSDRNAVIKASALKASQAEMEGSKVAGMMLNKDFDPKKQKITVSRDGYVVDGHHTWAAAVGRDAEDGVLGDMELEVVQIDLPMSTIYHIANRWTKKFGMPQAGVKKYEQMLRFRAWENHRWLS